MMDLTHFIENYGYWAVFVGSLLEGEMIVSIAGAFAYKGMLSFLNIVLISAFATIIAEQICFNIGRFLGARYLHRFPTFHARIEKAFKLLHKYQIMFILTCRFLYGLRIVSPFIIGAAKISPYKFTILNVIAAFIWAILSTTIGYGGSYFGDKIGGNCGCWIEYAFIGLFITCSITIIPFFIKKLLNEQ